MFPVVPDEKQIVLGTSLALLPWRSYGGRLSASSFPTTSFGNCRPSLTLAQVQIYNTYPRNVACFAQNSEDLWIDRGDRGRCTLHCFHL